MTDETKIAIAEAKEASKRSRSIVLWIQIACIAAFVALWQERQSGWPMTRLQAARAATIAAACPPPYEAWNPCIEKARATSNGDPDFDKGVALLRQWRFDQQGARNWLSYLQQATIARVLNPGVPGLGASIDVNDLCLFAGITFVTLLMWLRFSLWREKSNIHYLFLRCRSDKNTDELVEAYELLAMAQVLSVPRMPYEERRRPMAWMPIVLVWSPAVVEGAILLYDKYTYLFGASFQEGWTDIQTLLGVGLWCVTVWLALECVKFGQWIADEWHSALADIRKKAGMSALPTRRTLLEKVGAFRARLRGPRKSAI